MKFKPAKNSQIIKSKLIYIKEDYSFDFEPRLSVDFSILIGDIELMFDSQTKLARQVCGYEPYSVWENRKLVPPVSKKIGLMIDKDIKSGYSIRIIDHKEMISCFDPSNGWVCIGKTLTFEDKDAIEFARNTIVVLKDGEIVSLWLKPVFK